METGRYLKRFPDPCEENTGTKFSILLTYFGLTERAEEQEFPVWLYFWSLPPKLNF